MELSADGVQTALAPRTVQFFTTVDSTNDIARAWLRAGAPDGALVTADEQRRGRGRMGRVWQTPPGAALAVSVILRPPAAVLPRVSMLGGVAACELVQGLGCTDVALKWPNDVQIGGRKVCGVLVEAEWERDELLGVVLGIGINVRLDFSGTELADSAVSLEPVLGRTLDRLTLLRGLMGRIDDWYARLQTPALYEAWRSRLSTIGQRVSVQAPNQPVCGTAKEVDEHGALLVEDDSGVVHRVVAGDIALGQTG